MHCRHASSPRVTEAWRTIMKYRFKAVNTEPTNRFVSGVQKQQVLECFWTSVWVKDWEIKSCSFVPTRFNHFFPCLLSLLQTEVTDAIWSEKKRLGGCTRADNTKTKIAFKNHKGLAYREQRQENSLRNLRNSAEQKTNLSERATCCLGSCTKFY